MQKKKIGILGGMGPIATVEIYNRIINHTDATTDQEHIRILIDNNPNILDRSSFILKKGKSPLTELIESAKLLERAGVDFIIMPCNTAHYFYNEIITEINIPIMNMIHKTAEYIVKGNYKNTTFSVLATEGTIKSGLYNKVFKEHNLNLIDVDDNIQSLVSKTIKMIKKGHRLDTGNNELVDLINQLNMSKTKYILGCTELSLINNIYKDVFIDPMEILVKEAIIHAGYSYKE